MRRRWLLALAVVGANLAGAHIYYVTDGVHFRTDNIDFGRPPRKVGYYWNSFYSSNTETGRSGTDYLGLRDGAGWDEREAADPAEVALKKAVRLESAGRLREALSVYRDLAGNEATRDDFVAMRTEVLPEALRRPRMNGLRDYLASTRPKGKPVLWGTRKLDPFLDTYVRYDAAMLGGKDLDALEALAERRPRSPRAEAALISVARRLLEEGRQPTPADLVRGRNALETLLKRYPHSRFRGNAFGWLARIDFLKGRYAAAAANYETMARRAAGPYERMNAYLSIALCQEKRKRDAHRVAAYVKCYRFGPPDWQMLMASKVVDAATALSEPASRSFSDLLTRDPKAMPAYFDIRLDLSETSSTARSNLAQLAEAWIKRHPRDPQAPYLRARIAEIHYGDARFAEAERTARKVLSGRASTDARALANYVLGSCARRKSKFAEAERRYRAILRPKAKGYLGRPAREALAIVLERQNKLDGALDEYFRLGYEWDVAYMLDARMTPEQVARYAASRPGPRQALLRYSAGMRLMRDRKWSAARREFARLSRAQIRKFACLDAKGQESVRGYDDGSDLLDPRAVRKDLEALDGARQSARGTEAKAAATLKMAQYYYAKRNLALYNPSLWRGMRALVIGHSWNQGLNKKTDREALKKHHYDHECMAQALQLCQEIARKYPKTKAAPEALWVGVNAAMRLATLNPYWRWEERRANHYGVAMGFCETILKHHPNHKLAAKAKAKIPHLKEISWEAHLNELEYGKYRKDQSGF